MSSPTCSLDDVADCPFFGNTPAITKSLSWLS
jgi:hypothetical protein